MSTATLQHCFEFKLVTGAAQSSCSLLLGRNMACDIYVCSKAMEACG
jgi:hypothetical protein